MNYFELVSSLIRNEQRKEDSVVMVWGHSWELEKEHLWGELEKLMKQDFVKKNAVGYQECFRR